MPEFDKRGRCYKCGGWVSRAKKTETWHHDNIDDYHKCGFVKVKRDIKEIKKIKDLKNNINSRETVLKKNTEIYNNWDKIEELFELRYSQIAEEKKDESN